MTVRELAGALALTPLAGQGGLENQISGGYCGDLLSWVMGRARSGDAWITVMGNLNSIAVAVLADVACIILADRSALDADAEQRANQQGVPVLRSEEDAFTLCCKLNGLL